MRITEPSIGLRFLEAGAEARLEELTLEENRIEPLAEFADGQIAEYLFHLLTLTVEEETTSHAADVQKLVVLKDYAGLLLEAVDKAVYQAFGLTPAEQNYIKQRLNRFPLNRLQPRYPWQAVRPRPIKAYLQDRFA